MEGRTEYRVEQVTARIHRLQRRRERRLLAGLTASCLLLTASLAKAWVVAMGGLPQGTAEISTYGAALLHEDAGGYVLVGVAAFAAGAAVTALCCWWHKKH